jgi:hypothetical protein
MLRILTPVVAPARMDNIFSLQGAAPVRMDWTSMIKACTQPYLWYTPPCVLPFYPHLSFCWTPSTVCAAARPFLYLVVDPTPFF